MLPPGDETVSRGEGLTADEISHLAVPWFLKDLAAATLGNIIGDTAMVGLVCRFIRLRGTEQRSRGAPSERLSAQHADGDREVWS